MDSRRLNRKCERSTRQKNSLLKLVIRRSITVYKYADDFTVINGSREIELHRAEWADWNYSGRLVFARRGRLSTADLIAFPDIKETEMLD